MDVLITVKNCCILHEYVFVMSHVRNRRKILGIRLVCLHDKHWVLSFILSLQRNCGLTERMPRQLSRVTRKLRGFRTGPTQTRRYSNRRWLEASNFGFRRYGDCTIYVAKAKALISCAVSAQLICPFVLAYVKCRVSHDATQSYQAQWFSWVRTSREKWLT